MRIKETSQKEKNDLKKNKTKQQQIKQCKKKKKELSPGFKPKLLPHLAREISFETTLPCGCLMTSLHCRQHQIGHIQI